MGNKKETVSRIAEDVECIGDDTRRPLEWTNAFETIYIFMQNLVLYHLRIASNEPRKRRRPG